MSSSNEEEDLECYDEDGGSDYDDWDMLEEPYDIVAEALPRAKEAQIVRVLRRVKYDPDLAILAIRKAKKLVIKQAKSVKSPLASPLPPSSPRPTLAPLAAEPLKFASPGLLSIPPPVLTPEQAGYLSTSRPHLSVVTLGHVDAGKSTLLGRLLYDLGLVPQRTLSKVMSEAHESRKGSFAFAWLFDHGREERSRGITVDVGVNHFVGRNADITLLDAPGHREFVPNMITGVAHADAAILVVDASPGEFEVGMGEGGGEGGVGQTREHAHLARAMGVQQVIVAVNKMDSPGVGWSEGRFREVEHTLRAFLTNTVGFAKDRVAVVPVSGLTGVNLVRGVVGVGGEGEGGEEEQEERGGRRGGGGGGGGSEGDSLADLVDGLGLGSMVESPSTLPTSATAQNNPRRFIANASQVRSVASWYSGPTLLGQIESLRIPPTHMAPGTSGGVGGGVAASLPLRFTVSDAHNSGGGGGGGGGGDGGGGGEASGISVAGKVESGWVCPGMNIVSWPSGSRGKIKAVINTGGGSVPVAGSGQCVELILGGFSDKGEVMPSSVICWPGMAPNALLPVLKFKVLLSVLPTAGVPLFKGQQFVLHTHIASEPCVLSRLLRTVKHQRGGGGGGGEASAMQPKKGDLPPSLSVGNTLALKPRLLAPGDLAVVRVVLSRRTCLTTFNDNKRLGSFALRYHGRTVAVGKVLKITR